VKVQESDPDLAESTRCLKGQQVIRTSRSLKDNVGPRIIKTVEAMPCSFKASLVGLR
jgi:hypothetical protein